jgi:DMSO/TMAO reductase YedYZ molybdopterin-dependent catalytic subunit
MPHKYGIKNIKLITHIAYAANRPDDYWAERGYDYYAGL